MSYPHLASYYHIALGGKVTWHLAAPKVLAIVCPVGLVDVRVGFGPIGFTAVGAWLCLAWSFASP